MALIDQPRQVSSTHLLALLGGDMVMFLVFAALGRSSHGMASGLAAALQVAETAAPFALGWLVTAPFVGAYRPTIVAEPRSMLQRTAGAWLIAWQLGLVLRALIRQSGIPLSFALVTLATNMVILVIWRGMFAWALARHRARQQR